MCRYRVTKYRCNHKEKNVILHCDLGPTCDDDHITLLHLKADMTDVRGAIRLHHTNTLHTQYQPLLSHLRDKYRSFFSRRSGNQGDVEGGLRQVETYLDGEIEAIAVNVVERFRVERFCDDGCWEGMVIREEEWRERERREREGRGSFVLETNINGINK